MFLHLLRGTYVGSRSRPRIWAFVALVVGILTSAALINGGDNGTDEFIARNDRLYVSILGAGYFVSRRLARSGSQSYSDDDR